MAEAKLLFVLIKMSVLLAPVFSGSQMVEYSSQQAVTTTTTITVTTTTYLNQNFRMVKSASSDKSNEKWKIKLQELTENQPNVFNEILQKQEYFDYFCSIFKYTEKRDVTSMQTFLRKLSTEEVRKFALVMKHITRNNAEGRKMPQYAVVKWNWYAVKNFAPGNWNTRERGSHFIKAQLYNLVNREAENTTYLKAVLSKQIYAEYLKRATGYEGDCYQIEEFRNWLFDRIGIYPRIIACAIRYITMHQQNPQTELKIASVAVERLRRVDWNTYAVNNFAPGKWNTNERGSHKIRTTLKKLVDEKAEDTTYLKRVLRNPEYVKFLKIANGYNGDEGISIEQFENWLRQRIESHPRIFACSIRVITRNQQNSYPLNISKIAKLRLDGANQQQHQMQHEQHQQQSSTTTTITTEVQTYIGQTFGNVVSISTDKDNVYSQITQFKNNHNDWILQVLQVEVYYNYVKMCTGFNDEKTDKQNKHLELRNYWVNNYFQSQETAFYTAVMLKHIFRHMQNSSYSLTIEKSQYIKTYYYSKVVTKTSSTSITQQQQQQNQQHQNNVQQQQYQEQHHVQQQQYQEQHHEQQQHYQEQHHVQQQQQQSVSHTEHMTFMQKFSTIKSESDFEVKRTMITEVQQFKARKDWMMTILQQNVYKEYVSACLGLSSNEVTVEKIHTVWTENFFEQDTCQFTAIMLKNIYLHMSGKKSVLQPSRYITAYKTHSQYQSFQQTVVSQTVTTQTTTEVSSSASSMQTNSAQTY